MTTNLNFSTLTSIDLETINLADLQNVSGGADPKPNLTRQEVPGILATGAVHAALHEVAPWTMIPSAAQAAKQFNDPRLGNDWGARALNAYSGFLGVDPLK